VEHTDTIAGGDQRPDPEHATAAANCPSRPIRPPGARRFRYGDLTTGAVALDFPGRRRRPWPPRLTDPRRRAVGHAARVQRAGRAVARFWRKAYEDNLTGLAAMVAYNLLLSIFPLALVALFVAGRVLRSPEVQQSVLADLQRLFPSAAESTLTEGIRRLQGASTTVGVIAVVTSAWVGASFWGALDTAFCRIYRRPCRTWVRQKLFALGMLVIVLLFIAASVAVPALQGLLATSARGLPFGLSDVHGLVYGVTLAASMVVLFGVLCATYLAVPKGIVGWRGVWPGALGATVAMTVVDLGFPLYLQNVSTLRAVGTSALFVLIALVWFYALAIILLGGAVVNELRLEPREGRRPAPSRPAEPRREYPRAMPDPETEELSTDQVAREAIERERARHAAQETEQHTHERRADRAAYLREKLDERAAAEDEAEREDG
jgi:YihY family inner membrane protein